MSQDAMNRTAAPILQVLRRAFRPSSAVRVLWLSVALLHGWLALHRVWTDETAGLADAARTLLCLAAVGYASLKIWNVATVFDAAPRRALAFGLLLVVLHWGVSAPRAGALDSAAETGASHLPALVLALPAMTLSLAFSVALLNSRRLRPAREREVSIPRPCFERAVRLFSPEPDSFALYRRPPPFKG